MSITNERKEQKKMSKQELLKKMIDASKYEVDAEVIDDDDTPWSTQVTVEVETFGKRWSICYQNDDMNREAVYTNDGADSGLIEARHILEDMDGFKELDQSDNYIDELDELIHEFCDYISEKEKISDMF